MQCHLPRNDDNVLIVLYIIICDSDETISLSRVEIKAKWSPHKKGVIEDIEKSKQATKLVISLRRITYEDRLVQLVLPRLKYRRLRDDMIEVFKIINENEKMWQLSMIATEGRPTRCNC